MKKLPINIMEKPGPRTFEWSQTITDLNGTRNRVNCTGPLPPSVEEAVAELISMTKQLIRDNESLAERVAKQSELLSKKAESSSAKKGK